MFDTTVGREGGCGEGAGGDVCAAVVADASGQAVEGGARDAKVVHHAVEAGSVHAVVGFIQVQGEDIKGRSWAAALSAHGSRVGTALPAGRRATGLFLWLFFSTVLVGARLTGCS